MAKGDHVYIKRGWYTHHGIDCGDGTVIHYNGTPYNMKNAEVAREPMDKRFPPHKVKIRKHRTSFTRDEIVARAESKLGEKEYHVIHNNCEHFVEWCYRDKKKSKQVRRLQYAISGIAAVGILAAVHAMFDSDEDSIKE